MDCRAGFIGDGGGYSRGDIRALRDEQRAVLARADRHIVHGDVHFYWRGG
ncbi:protein of unknown function [Citrobacter amalonaticus]|uniref:Uncharacterized protein n=1 Tax=Citrobacter amalonaticus TaxID=35703 RepID=A0AAX2BD69_CITAM|nr:protein of unknown function [Citrobacter amalonaticus]